MVPAISLSASKRLVLVAPGSRGDVQPFVALAGGLRRAGYLVRVAAHETFRALVEAQDAEFAALTGDPQALLLDSTTQRIVDSGGNPLRALRGVRAALRELGSTVIADASQAARDADAVVHCGPLSLPAFYAAQALKVPSIGAAVQPLTATRAFPTVAAGGPRLPGQINLLSHLLAEQAFWGLFRPAISRWRREHAQHAAPLLGPFRGWRAHGHQFVYGFSPNLLPRPPDWGPNDHVTGAWLLDSPAQARLSDELEAFLAAGPPPVYIGFGSMTTSDPRALTEIVTGALERAGQRAVLGSGWVGLGARQHSERILVVGETPHDLLFARVLAVVHHGGAGTTHAGLRAGVPNLAVPFGADQAFWGERIAATGAGPPPIPRRQLTIDRLADALHTMARNQQLRRRAAVLGERLADERGIDRAATTIARALKDPRGDPRSSSETPVGERD